MFERYAHQTFWRKRVFVQLVPYNPNKTNRRIDASPGELRITLQKYARARSCREARSSS
jgi:hypothetical protein